MTSNTDLAAALMASGVAPIENSPVSNTYSKEKPYTPGKPGNVLYHLKVSSDTFKNKSNTPISAEKLASGFNSTDANELLDELIEKIQDQDLKDKIKEQLPLAIMSHHRAAFGNRSIIRKWWRNVQPWVYIQRGNKKFLLPRTAKNTAKKWGLTNE